MIVTGTPAANRLRGTADADVISGLAGNDTAFGGLGNDSVNGNDGADILWGEGGRDTLNGGAGNDVLYGFGSGDVRSETADITAATVGSGFSRPVYATSAPGDPDRLYVVEQHVGRIRILDTTTGAVAGTPFLDLPDATLPTGSEQGLLGLAFHPDYASNGRFFVFLTRLDGDVEVRAYQRSATNPNVADPASGDTILLLDKDTGRQNHNGGWLAFGPDGNLYVAIGDEGAPGDPSNNAQSVTSLWGKILRIDVDGDAFGGDANRDYLIPAGNPFAAGPGADEIWALGLRNPWRNSFDRLTGDLYIADVGESAREEINVQLAGAAGGANYGWKVKEGELVFDASVPGNPAPNSPSLTDPLVAYPHDASGGFAVVGGYVYRGESAGMQGRYVYADYVSDRLWSFALVNGRAVDVTDHTAQVVGGTLDGITSFAEDGRGNLYAIGIGGSIFRLDFGAGAADGADRLVGGGGNDALYGGAGNDTLDGGTGQDSLFGGSQADLLRGSEGHDQLRGGAGADRLNGGTGNDTLAGGPGADSFVFAPGDGVDRIDGFNDDLDTIQLAGFGFASPAAALDTADQVGANVVFALGAGQSVTVVGTTVAALADDLVV